MVKVRTLLVFVLEELKIIKKIKKTGNTSNIGNEASSDLGVFNGLLQTYN